MKIRKETWQNVEYTLKTGRSPTLERRYSPSEAQEIRVPVSDVPYLETCSPVYLSAYFIMFCLEEAKRKANAQKNKEENS